MFSPRVPKTPQIIDIVEMQPTADIVQSPPTQNGSQTPDTAQIEDILQMAAHMAYLIGQSFCVSIGQLFMKWSFLIGSFSCILIGG
jgi:hypothetical protein